MPELEEFAEALIGQLSVELNEEKEIAGLAEKIAEDNNFTLKFEPIEQIAEKILPELKQKASEFLGIPISDNIKLEFPKLKDFKLLKGKKVFCIDEARNYVDELFNKSINNEQQVW